jgi:hypothetical protein
MHSTSSFKPKHPQITSQNLGKPQKAAQQPRKQAPNSRLFHQRKRNGTPHNRGSNAAQSASGA